jgi:hypothetical protein
MGIMIKKIQYVILFSLFCSIFISPVFADAADDDSGLEDSLTFHVFEDVDLVSTLKFEYGKPKIIIKSVYPQLASETEREGVDTFNDIVLEMVREQISAFRNQVKNHASLQKTLPKNKITNNLYIDYNTSYVKSKQNRIMSIRFSIQANITGTGRPSHQYITFNYDLEDNKPIELNELFLSDSNYLSVLSDYTRGVLDKRLSNKNLIEQGTQPTNNHFANWNIRPDGLLITFNESQVAPAALGTQMVLVPYAILSHIIAPDSPIAYCVEHEEKCRRGNLLTGGFIDEALNTRQSFTMLAHKG